MHLVAGLVLIVAHRDAAARSSLAELSGTATLLELGRVFAARETKRTIVLVSSSGGSGGDAGVAALPAQLRGPFDAAIVIGDVAGTVTRTPVVVPFSDGVGSAPLALQRTVADAITAEAGFNPGAPSVLGQLAHLVFPFATGEQGVLDADGLPAVLVQASGERGPSPHEALSGERLQGIGRGILDAVDALDTAPDISPAMQTSVVLQRQVLPAWAVELLGITLLVPVLVAAVDALARVRRRRRPVGRWDAVDAQLLAAVPLLRAVRVSAGTPRDPGLRAVRARARQRDALRRQGRHRGRGGGPHVRPRVGPVERARATPRLGHAPHPDVAGLALLLILAPLAVIVWLGDPFTALLLVPAVHLWLVLAAPELRPRRPLALLLVALALAPLALLIVFYAHQLGVGVGGVAWSMLQAVAGGHVGPIGALLWSVALGCAAAATMLAARGERAPLAGGPDERVEVNPRSALLRGAGLARRHGVRSATIGTRCPISCSALGAPGGSLAAPRRARRRRSSRALRALALALIALGALALLDAGVTLLWQEPISALIATLRQDHLSSALRKVERAAPTPAEQRTLASLGDERRRIAFLASELQRHTGDGGAVGRILIPRIGADFVVVKGTGTEELKSGPGIYSGTSLPGLAKTTAIAGHRTTYLAPFRHIDALAPGNHILLNMPYAHFTYTVSSLKVVSPYDWGAVRGEVGYSRLVLSACTPLFSAAKRLLVYARLTRTVPVGSALVLPGGALAHPIEASPHSAPVRALAPMLESLDPHQLSALV